MRAIIGVLVFLAWALTAMPAAARPPDPLAAATTALCGKRIALIGENGMHGSGPTLAFKAALVQRLIDRCGYRAVLFEASRYDFVAFDRAVAKGTADRAMLSAAVGGLWARYGEFVPLADFLVNRARAGTVRVAGLDDAVGIRGAAFANGPMIDELARSLDSALARACTTAFRERLNWDYASPSYDSAARGLLRRCTAAMRQAWGENADQIPLIAALDRMLARDLAPSPEQYAGRELSMFAAFNEVMAKLPAGTKVIVWGATAHFSRDTASWPPLAGRPNLGMLVHRAYGRSAFTLGFSALAGGWRRTPGKPLTPWSAAPATSIEARALRRGADIAFVDAATLHRLGDKPARLWNDTFVAAPWHRIVDALVVFRTDQAPTALP